jgi:hypothetical protein
MDIDDAMRAPGATELTARRRRILLRGSLLAACAAAASWALAALGFRRPYYLAVLLPLCMTLYLLVAWLMYLKDDGFIRDRSAAARKAGTAKELPAGASPPGPPEFALLAPRDDIILSRDDIIAKHTAPPEGRKAAEGEWDRDFRASLVVAAIALGLAAAALYAFAGIGTRFFL